MKPAPRSRTEVSDTSNATWSSPRRHSCGIRRPSTLTYWRCYTDERAGESDLGRIVDDGPRLGAPRPVFDRDAALGGDGSVLLSGRQPPRGKRGGRGSTGSDVHRTILGLQRRTGDRC